VLDRKIVLTCSLIVDRVAKRFEELQGCKMNQGDENPDDCYDDETERFIIEQFGQCLVDVIETAEKRGI
jgi:hypothetical protein